VTPTLVVIPFRGSRGAKTRLAAMLPERQRARLALAMLRHMIDVVTASHAVEHTLIVTREPDEVRGVIGASDATTLLRQPDNLIGLNGALDVGRAWATAHGFGAMLVMPGDLPTIGAPDVERAAGSSAPIAIAPDRHRQGTNALLLRLDPARVVDGRKGRFTFAFGDQSFRRHLSEAARLGLEVEHLHLRGVALDLDTPDDWQLLPIATRNRLCMAMVEPAERSESQVALKGA